MGFYIGGNKMTLDIIDLSKSAYRVLPPARWQVVITFGAIVVTALLWGLS